MKQHYLIAITFLSLVLSACTRARPEAPNVVLPTLALPSPIPTLAPTANPTTVAGGPAPTLLIIVTPIRQPATEVATATLTSAPRLSTATRSAAATTAPSATLPSAGPSTVTIAPNASATMTPIPATPTSTIPAPTQAPTTLPTRAPATPLPTAVAQNCPGARACILISPTVANLKLSAVSLSVRGYGFPTGQVTINIGPKSSNCLLVNSCISAGIAHAGIGGNFDATVLILPNNPLLADVRQLQVLVVGGRGTVRATADLTNTGGR